MCFGTLISWCSTGTNDMRNAMGWSFLPLTVSKDVCEHIDPHVGKSTHPLICILRCLLGTVETRCLEEDTCITSRRSRKAIVFSSQFSHNTPLHTHMYRLTLSRTNKWQTIIHSIFELPHLPSLSVDRTHLMANDPT